MNLLFFHYFFLLTIKITIPRIRRIIGTTIVKDKPNRIAYIAETVRLLSVYSFSGITLPASSLSPTSPFTASENKVTLFAVTSVA